MEAAEKVFTGQKAIPQGLKPSAVAFYGTTKEAAEKVAVANRKRPSAAKAGPVFNQLRTG
jgi:hypothetical protein